MEYHGEERRDLRLLTDSDVEKIAIAVARKTHEAFRIDEEKHYNDHRKLDAMLTAYEGATNIFWKAFLGLIIAGALILAGIGVAKGVK
jgi:hypothetical protein